MRRYYFDEEHEIFRDAFRTFLEREVQPHLDRWGEQGHVDKDIWLKAGENGFVLPRAPEYLGGLGIEDFRYEQIMIEEQGYIGDVGWTLYNPNTITGPYFLKHASEELRQRYIPPAARGEIVFGIAMTEPSGGSDLAAIRTKAELDGDHYVINGSKTFISNGIIGDVFIVAARTEPEKSHGISLFAVEAGWEGFRRGRMLSKMGFDAQDTAELIFDDLRVPQANLIGEQGMGFRYMMQGLSEERTSCAIQSLANAEYAFKLTLDYVKERKVFGQAVAAYQNTQFKLAELRAKMDMAQAFLDTLV